MHSLDQMQKKLTGIINQRRSPMYCKGLKQLKADQKKGISMAIVLCVSAFFIAFAAATPSGDGEVI